MLYGNTSIYIVARAEIIHSCPKCFYYQYMDFLTMFLIHQKHVTVRVTYILFSNDRKRPN